MSSKYNYSYPYYSAGWWREYQREHKEHLNELKRGYSKKYYKTRKEQENARRKKWASANKEKINAQQKLAYQIKKGCIIRPDICELCGKNCKVHAHHDDYNKPLQVQWLCPMCHYRPKVQ